MFPFPKSRRGRIILAAGVACLLLLVIALALLNPVLTRYVEGGKFAAAMDMETAKGLHFESGHYAAIRRTGFATAADDAFEGTGGRKAIVSMSTRGITAKFNPWGIFLRRWQLDDVHIDSGDVEIHTYEPKPEPIPSKPWYAVFLPDRVYLKQVVCDTANVTWQLRGKKSGFFATRLLVTPHGRDFEYRAEGGTMKMALMPDLYLRGTHLLITKQLLTLYNLDLAPDEKSAGSIHLTGHAGLKEDKSVDAEMTFAEIPVAAWLPESWRGHVAGIASGDAHWSGGDTKVETSSGTGTFRLEHGRVSGLPLLQKLASITGKKSLETLEPGECAFRIEWNYPKLAFKEIAIEERGKFRIEGALSIDHHALGGEIRLGMAPEYLAWLPDAGEVFTRGDGDYWWVTVHLSGTIEKPQQDLSPRISSMLEEHPGALLEFFFQEAGEDFKKIFEGQ
jgi:hypothetical protein